MKSQNISYFALGRNAMYAVCRILDLQKDDEILTPAWDCDGALEAFRPFKCKLIFYRSDPYTFEVDIEHLRSLISNNTKLIHIINHFGQTQDWDEILKLRKEIDVPILEDNAYSFLSGINNKKFGSFGDFAIFSLRKSLPLPDGGMLKINCGMKYKVPPKKQRWLYPPELGRTKDILLSYVKREFGLENVSLSSAFKKGRKPSKYLPPLYSNGRKDFPPWKRSLIGKDFAFDYERPMSKLSQLIFFKHFTPAKLEDIAKVKRRYYSFLADELKNVKGIQILHTELKDGVVPLCIAMLIDKNRDNILNSLQKKNIQSWPGPPCQ